MEAQTGFKLFGPSHFLILAAIPILAGILSWAARRNPKAALWIRVGLGSFLVLNELSWYGYEIHTSGLSADMLPLQLCDITLWVTALACLTLNAWCFEMAYFIGICGSGMAIITPDIWEPLGAYTTNHFFLMHGGAVTSILFLTWSGLARPRPGSLWRAFLYLNIYAGLVGIVNIAFKANYMYLCAKPEEPSILDYFGPWPIYILSSEALAIALFTLLWLPVRNKSVANVKL